MNFINSNKTQINLPVPLGSKVYRLNTKCCDVCLFQKELRKKHSEEIQCNMLAPCHTRLRPPIEHEVTLCNLEFILTEWNTKVFPTRELACERGKELVEQHIKRMRELGFKLTEAGYSCVS